MHSRIALVASLASLVRGQQVGSYQSETHPSLTWQKCTSSKSCSTVNGKVVIDANWRWVHKTGDYTNCYTGNKWDTSLCSSNTQGASNCALEGADYAKTYGATTSGNALTLKFIQKNDYGTNVGSRLYLMDSSDTNYEQFNLLNQEFTFDVDVSKLPCGLNGALYFVSMDKDGGKSRFSSNKAGAKYGTGYCDGQCPRDLKFINGQANCEGWQPSSNDANAGVGNHGSCCAEMDVWEANSISAAVTPHSCDTVSQTQCNGDNCGGTYSSTRYAGTCDPDGCDFNSYRLGDTTFYGKGKKVDTSQKFTVVTQFIGNPLTEIKRFYVQNGKLIPNSQSKISGVTGNSITPTFCDQAKAAFGDVDPFKTHGGFTSMSKAMSGGMTLVMSVWDDHYANMLWLDSTYPVDKTGPGGPRGECSTSSGVPATVESANADAQVIYSNIKFGPINSTYTAT